MRDPPRHTRACGITRVDPHPATLARPPLREEESSEALERLRAAMRGSGAERVYVKVVERRSRDAERTYN